MRGTAVSPTALDETAWDRRVAEALELSGRGRIEAKEGSLEEALRLYERALSTLAGGPPTPLLSEIYRWMGTVRKEMGAIETARDLYVRALQVAEEVGSLADQADALNCLAVIAQREGDIPGAEALYRRAARDAARGRGAPPRRDGGAEPRGPGQHPGRLRRGPGPLSGRPPGVPAGPGRGGRFVGSQQHGDAVDGRGRVSPGGGIRALRDYAWPGNVRELKSVIQRAAALAEGGMIGPEHLAGRDRRDRAPFGSEREEAGRISIPVDGLSLEEIEAEALRITLQITGGNKSAAARIPGWSRPTVGRKVDLYELEGEHGRTEDGGSDDA